MKQKSHEEWTDADEKRLELLHKLNSRGAYGIPGATIDMDIQMELEAKKKRVEKHAEKKQMEKEKEEDFNKT